jgi:glycosyltransferase involved in cell wall biosynthesis
LALAEGMASGAVPVVLQRPGATEQYDARWLHASADAAAQAVLAVQERGENRHEGERAATFAERWSWARIWPKWERLLLREPVASMSAMTVAA